MENAKIEQKKIYDDFETLANNKKRNSLTIIFKSILLSFFAISSILLLFFSSRTLLANKLFINKDLQYFLVFSNLTTERLNYIVLFRLFFLASIFIYSISKNYSNVIDNKVYTKKYIPWFITYLLFSCLAFILLFTFFKLDTLDYYYLSLICLPLLFLDIAYSIYSYKIKKKTNPIVYSNNKLTIISIISRSSFVLAFFITLTIWIFSIKGDKFDFLNNNIIHNWFVDMFSKNDIKNLFFVILFFAFILLCFFGTNIEKIADISSKKYNFKSIKEKLVLWSIFGFSTIVWFIRVLFYKNSSNVIGKLYSSNNFLYLLGLIPIIGIFVFYMLFSFVKKMKMKSTLSKNIILGFCLSIVWITIAIITLISKSTLVNNILLLIAALNSITMILLYRLQNNSENVYATIFIQIITLFITITLILNGLNALLISHNNEAFYNIDSPLSLNLIFIITTLALSIGFNTISLMQLGITLFRLTKNKKELSEAK
ncbi:hypothetical protein DMC14_003185 [Metamycoplasma phocicerebrale]|uniref:Uncharacterized protein n=1 Tax=Metamycoplasma phocicerebrale TaxID=142649 RepID=A0A3T0TUI8_9BACT|nr:hypothetical protein [Metamycoplasma phocicerebrale]AZZ65767.1 hypothetical protein DMC14_003185 [Metamycoplasma phocicerebrale]